MKLIGNKILIERIENTNKTKSGIYLPHMEQIDKNEAIVLLVGPKVKGIKPNDKIRLFPHVTGTMHEHEGKNCTFVTSDDVDLIL